MRKAAGYETVYMNRKELPGLLCFILPYLAVICFFAYVDVYHQHFFNPRYSLPYNAARTVFVAYLFWFIYFSGAVLLGYFRGYSRIPWTQRLGLGLFSGAAIWTLGMLVLGYLSLYFWIVAVAITTFTVAASYRHFRTVGEICVQRLRMPNWRGVGPIGMALIAVAFGAVLLMVKGLYPAGGHDYFTHYFYYYNAVIDRHNIWPNEVWYHYYYSKAMGLFFLGMLLTDPLAPSLITFVFAIATAVALFAFVDRVRPRTLWPWVSVALYFALYITTYSSGAYTGHGGWGDFQKPHEINAAFIFGLLWMGVGLLTATEAEERRIWWFASALCAFVVAFVTTVSSLLVGLFYCLLLAGCLLLRNRRNAMAFFGLSVATGAGLVSVLVLNYLTTGVPLDNGMEFFWPIIDLKRLREWGMLPEVVLLMLGRLSMAQSRLPLFSDEMWDFLQRIVRDEVLHRLFVYTALATGLAVVARVAMRIFRATGLSMPAPPTDPTVRASSPGLAFAVGVAFLAATFAVALVAGSTQSVSFVRYTSFLLPTALGMAATVWLLILSSLPKVFGLRFAIRYLAPVALLVLTLNGAFAGYGGPFVAALTNAARFVTGKFSIYDSYVDQSGWPGRGPDGAIRPWAFAAWKQLGPGTRFWVFDTHTYCMLPDCRPEAMMSFRLSPHLLDILFGTAPAAREILQREGLNYFLFTMEDRISDPLLCSALFAPDHVAEYFGTKWRDSGHALLTWLGPGVEPLSPELLEGYRAQLRTQSCGHEPILRELAKQLPANPRWGADLIMPWSRR